LTFKSYRRRDSRHGLRVRSHCAPKPPGVSGESAYRNGQPIGIPKAGAMDCTMVAAAPVLPVGYVVSASRIADRRMILAGYRLADLLMRATEHLN
jgi:hypothetical protein